MEPLVGPVPFRLLGYVGSNRLRLMFTFDPLTGRYRAENGRFVRDVMIIGALDRVINAQADATRDLTQQLIDGALPLAVWQMQMMQSIKAVHLVGLALANGGWAQLDQSDFGWVGQRIREQYRFLIRFSIELGSGRQQLDGTAIRRAQMYIHAARATHREALRRLAEALGMAQERNVLGICDHCRGCKRETRRSWVPIGTLIPIGSRDCLVNCHCHLDFRARPAA